MFPAAEQLLGPADWDAVDVTHPAVTPCRPDGEFNV